MGIVNHIIEVTVSLLRDYGVPAVFVLMVLESACIPAPSEVIMLFGGYLVSQGDATFAMVVAAGVSGNVVGSLIAWAAGAYGGRVYLERHGKWLHVTPARLNRADHWFEQRGHRAVFISRMLPIIRTFISLPAGVSRMPIGRFTTYTMAGCIPWVAALTYIGLLLGPQWERAHGVLHYLDYLVVVGVIALGAALLGRSRRTPDVGT